MTSRAPVIACTRWSIFDRKKLIKLLKEYPIDAYESIAMHFRDKTVEQVETYIRKMKHEIRNKNRIRPATMAEVQRVPLEQWLEIAADLVDYEHVDCSSNLIKVMSIISKFEDFQSPNVGGYDGPDYASIYKFLSQLLQPTRNEDLVTLGPLESAIMLDMIHGLMDVLSKHDTTVQRNVMKWKHILMTFRKKTRTFPEILRKASENDYKEFIEIMREEENQNENRETVFLARRAEGVDQQDKSAKQSSSCTSQRPSTTDDCVEISVPSTSTPQLSSSGTMPTSSSETVAPQPSSLSSTVSVPSSSSSSSSVTAASSSDTLSLIDKIPDQKPEIRHHKPGRKGPDHVPETPRTEIVLVMPPAGVKIVNYNVRPKKEVNVRLDGKYKPINNDEELVSNDLNREVTYDIHRSELQKTVEISGHVSEADKTARKKRQREAIQVKYDELLALHTEESRKRPVKKQKLFSINPFCLPVSLIDLNSMEK